MGGTSNHNHQIINTSNATTVMWSTTSDNLSSWYEIAVGKWHISHDHHIISSKGGTIVENMYLSTLEFIML